MKVEMLINARQLEESRIAIVEDGILEELYIERVSQENYVGNIYKGRIVNIEPSIQAAFVDFGVGRNGFLHISDVEPQYFRQGGYDIKEGNDPRPAVKKQPTASPADEEAPKAENESEEDSEDLSIEDLAVDFDEDTEEPPKNESNGSSNSSSKRSIRVARTGARPRFKPPIQEVFRKGDEVLVQVIKEGIGTKGPTLSTYISIPGRYLVLMPALGRVGVSRKIEDEDVRKKLKAHMDELEPPKGLGFIVRTAGADRNKKELSRDLAYLLRLWRVIVRRIKKETGPTDIYEESDMIIRTIRDIFSNNVDRIYVDDPAAYERAKEFLQLVMPRHVNRLRLYEGKEPLFQKFGIEDEISKINDRNVALPRGGSIVIDQAEALVAIDVNSGNFRSESGNAEDTAFEINMIASKEIARQLRLRDLGGVVVNDFIDMRRDKHRRLVEKSLRDSVKRDRARTKILRTSPFGLIEMTRQRIRPSLRRSVYGDCPCCSGSGLVKKAESVAIEALRLLMAAACRDDISKITTSVNETVANFLNNHKRAELSKLEESGSMLIEIIGQENVGPEHLDITCFTESGKEVEFSRA